MLSTNFILMLANLFSWWKLDKICYLLQTAAFLCCSKVSFVFVCVCVFYLILFKRQKYSKNWYTVCKSICFKYAIRHYLKYLETKCFAFGYVYMNLDTFENRVFILIRSPSTLTVSKSFSSTLKCQKTLNLPYCACVKSHKSNKSSLRLYRWNRHNEFSCNYSGRIIFFTEISHHSLMRPCRRAQSCLI